MHARHLWLALALALATSGCATVYPTYVNVDLVGIAPPEGQPEPYPARVRFVGIVGEKDTGGPAELMLRLEVANRTDVAARLDLSTVVLEEVALERRYALTRASRASRPLEATHVVPPGDEQTLLLTFAMPPGFNWDLPAFRLRWMLQREAERFPFVARFQRWREPDVFYGPYWGPHVYYDPYYCGPYHGPYYGWSTGFSFSYHHH